MIDNLIITILSICIVESAVFTLCFINNSRRILAFSCFIMSWTFLLIFLDMEFFALTLGISFMPVIFVLFMLGNMVRNKKEIFIKKKTAVIAGTSSAIIITVLSLFCKSEINYNSNKNLFLSFSENLYGKYLPLTVLTGILIFISVISIITIFFNDKTLHNSEGK